MTARSAVCRRLGGPVLAAVLGLALVGCASVVTVSPTSTTAAVHEGEQLVVDFGEINSSVGDDWVVVTEPDPDVLGPASRKSDYLGEDDEDGAPNELRFAFDARGRGSTTIEFEYRFRGSNAEEDAPSGQLRTASINVTVD